MKRKFVWVVVSGLVVVALLLAACAPVPAKETAPAAPAAPAVKEAVPAVKEAAPAVKETTAPPAGALPVVKKAVAATRGMSAPAVQELAPGATPDTVKVTLAKLDGTIVVKEYVKPKYGGSYTIYSATPVTAWDEALQAPWTTSVAITYLYEELVQGDWTRGPAGTGDVDWKVSGWMASPVMTGALAESWELPDDTTAIFHIRKGVRWHNKPPVNGREFTADDVVFNIKRIYFGIPTSTMYGMAGVSRPTDVYATDKYTVVLKAPKGQLGKTWEYVVDWTRMLPREATDKDGYVTKWENVTGTGPFILRDYVNMSSTTYKRNPDYWMSDPYIPENKLPYLDTHKVICIPDASTQIAAMRTAKVDGGSAKWEQANSLMKTTPQISVLEYASAGYNLIGWRQDKPELPFKDIRVRRALSMAINYQEMVDTYYGGKGFILVHKIPPIKEFMHIYTPVGQLPPAADGFDNNLLYTYHPDLAKKLLAEAGYPNGFKTEVTYYGTGFEGVDQLTMIQEYWKRIGVDMKLDIKEYAVYLSMYQRKTHNEGLMVGRWPGEPFSMFTCRKGSMYNWGMVDDPKMDAYYDQMTAAYFDTPKRDAIMKEANLYIISQVNYICPPVGYTWYFRWPWMKNYNFELSMGVGSNHIVKYMWLDQDLKKKMGY